MKIFLTKFALIALLLLGIALINKAGAEDDYLLYARVAKLESQVKYLDSQVLYLESMHY